jgi:hypothetical protein
VKEREEQKVEQHTEPTPVSYRLRKFTAILLLALIAFVGIDAYFNNWSIVRTLASLNTLQLKNKSGQTWDLLARRDFQIVRVKDVQQLVNGDSLLAFDQSYRDSGFYRLYFRHSDSSSARMQRMYQAFQSLDTAQTVKHTLEDAKRAYRNLQIILHPGQPIPVDSVPTTQYDSSKTVSRGDLALGSGDETSVVIRKFVSNPQVLVGAGIGIVAMASVNLLRGDAYVAYAKENVFGLDSIAVGTRVGLWEGSPIDILWAFAPKETVGKDTTAARNK